MAAQLWGPARAATLEEAPGYHSNVASVVGPPVWGTEGRGPWPSWQDLRTISDQALNPPGACLLCAFQVALLVAAEFWEQGDLERTVLDQQPIVSVASSILNSCLGPWEPQAWLGADWGPPGVLESWGLTLTLWGHVT